MMMASRLKAPLAVALGALACACTLDPDYHRPAAPGPAVATQAGPAATDIGWREIFPDRALQQLIELALANSRDLRIAALRVQSAQAQYRIQRAELFPSVAGSATGEIERLPAGVFNVGSTTSAGPPVAGGSTFRFYDVGVGFTNYELDVFGHLRSLSRAAQQQYFSERETQRSTQLSLVAEVAAAYLAVLADQSLLDITRQTLRNQTESYELTQRMFAAGTTSELVLRQAETTVDTARANLALYDRQLAQDRDALQLLLGTTLPQDLDDAGGLDRATLVAELQEGIPSEVLIQRPDVLAAEHQLLAANAQIGAARAAFFPSITLTGSYGTASSQLSGLFKAGSQAWTLSPQISVPLFTGGANVANLQATKLARDTAVAQYEKAIQTAFREVADALAARRTLDDQLQAQEALVTAAAKAYRLADMRFRGGVDNYLATLVEQRTLYASQQELVLVRLLRLQNLVTLYKALGGGLLEHSAAPQAAPPPAASPAIPRQQGSPPAG
jgi:multidrug efflux system outer membrane protein